MPLPEDTAHFQRAPGSPDLPATPLRFIWYITSRYRIWYVAMVFLEAINASCGIVIPYSVSQIIRSVTSLKQYTDAVADQLQGPLVLFTILGIGEVLFGRLSGGIQIRLGPRQRQHATRELYHYLQHHSHTFITNDFAGALAHRISEASLGVSQTMWSILTEFWPAFIVLGVAITLLLRANIDLGMLLAVWAVLFVGLSFLLARRCRPHAVNASAARSETTGKVVDSVTNLASARLFARFAFEREYLSRYLRKELKAVLGSNRYAERVRWFQFAAAAVLKLLTLYYALYLWRLHQIDVGQFVMAVSLALLVITEVRNLSRRFLELFEYFGNVANGVYTIVRPHDLVDAPDAKEVPITRGLIEFRNVTFGYSPDRPLFEGLNVTIRAGQRVGLVGLSGSGKSTFVSLILRMYDPQQGEICVDHTDIRTMTQDALHSQLSLIPQDPSLFHRTLMENIRYGLIDASDSAVIDAARRAHAHEFISQMPQGYDSMVGERGVKLSGGQRQRVAIARVVLKNAPILILDEATSSLDSITEKAIQETLDEVMIGKTVIVVAHRLSTVAHLDRILVFDQGRVVEDDTHTALLARRGTYHRLWSRQSDGFFPEEGQEASLASETQ